jgi:hypothetical protein
MWFTNRLVNGKPRRQARILGLQADAEMARYLYEMITAAIASGWRTWAAGRLVTGKAHAVDNRRAIASFRVGMAMRINERLVEMARALDSTAKTGSGTALVVVKDAIVNEAYAKLNLHFGRGRIAGMAVRDGAAYHAGQVAGDKVNLSRPINAGPAAKRLH